MSRRLTADGVFSGGGVKAVAFAGALAAAEEAGYGEWDSLAGTSAGAIVAAALATGYDAAGLARRLEHLDLAAIADVGRPRRLAQTSNLIRHYALARGRALHGFVERLLGEAPRPARTFGELDRRLQVVATDLVHRRMVVFPDDAPHYLHPAGRPLAPEEMPIADAVRMSAGYPFMFSPVPLRDCRTGKRAVIVDGGVVSGFPVFLFDQPDPRHPTWGFRLIDDRSEPTELIDGWRWPVQMIKAIIETSIGAHDRLQAEAFSSRTVTIETGSVPTLKFGLTPADRRTLWRAGHAAGSAFFAAQPSGRNSHGAVPAATIGRVRSQERNEKNSADRRAEQKGTEYV